MKRILFYISLCISTVAFSQSGMVKAEVDNTNIKIGEQFLYSISVTETENVIIPKLHNLNGLEVVDSLKTDTINNKIIKKYVMTGFDSGSFYIPKQQIFIRNQVYETDSLLINVATIPIDTTKIKKFPIKGIKGEPIQFDDYKNIIFWALAIFLVVGTVLYFALKRTPDTTAKTYETILAPYQEALRNLKLLDDKLLWQNNKVKAYYSELTNIVRHYVERELKIPALERTTNGLIENLYDFKDSESIDTDKETIKKLEVLLNQADLVKFAKSKPLASEIEGDRNIAEHIISNLKQTITEAPVDPQNIQPVILVQKPEIKKPSILVRIVIVLLIIFTVSLISYGISKGLTMSHSLKQTPAYVQ